MTEKRFELNNIVKKGTVSFWDNEKEAILNASHLLDLLNKLADENEQLKQSNNEAIELILDGIVEMHDGKRDYAETIFNKAIKLLKGDVE